MPAFPEISKIAYEGPQSKNPLAFRWYNPSEKIDGKTMAVLASSATLTVSTTCEFFGTMAIQSPKMIERSPRMKPMAHTGHQ